MLDLEALLSPITEDAPSGPDLEYDPEWQALERLAQGKPEQQFGDTIIPAEEPDWREISSKAEALLGRSKDVRSACLLARALTRLEQFEGLGQGLSLVHQLLDRYWQTVHPQLDASDNDDPTMRINALAALADPQGLLRDARSARLFSLRQHGELTPRQIEVALSKSAPRSDETALTEAQVEQQLAAVLQESPGLADVTRRTFEAARDLSRLLDDKVGGDRSPDLKPLVTVLNTVNQLVTKVAASLAPNTGSDGATDMTDANSPGSSGGASAVSAASGAIRSRADVVLLIDKICEYLQRTEPTNPAPFMLQRAKRFMDMDFLQILSEMSPDSMDQARVITGVRAPE